MQTCIAGSIHSLFSENSADIRRIVDNQHYNISLLFLFGLKFLKWKWLYRKSQIITTNKNRQIINEPKSFSKHVDVGKAIKSITFDKKTE